MNKAELREHLRLIRRHMKEQNRLYGPTPVQIPKEQWPQEVPGVKIVWRSNRYLVQIYQEPTALRMSVCRTEIGDDGKWRDGITWDELHQLKNQCGFADRWMVELYPPASDTVNVANIRHLWLLPEPPSFGWHESTTK